jgi:phytoene dehydrogenase-like protein
MTAGRPCTRPFVLGPVWAELGAGLRRHGLEYVTAPLATGSSLPGGRTAVVPVSREGFAAELDRLGETAGWGALFGAARPHIPVLLELLGGGLDSPQARAALSGLSPAAGTARCRSGSC